MVYLFTVAVVQLPQAPTPSCISGFLVMLQLHGTPKGCLLGMMAHVTRSDNMMMPLSFTLGGRNVAHWQDRMHTHVHIPVEFSPCQIITVPVSLPL